MLGERALDAIVDPSRSMGTINFAVRLTPFLAGLTAEQVAGIILGRMNDAEIP